MAVNYKYPYMEQINYTQAAVHVTEVIDATHALNVINVLDVRITYYCCRYTPRGEFFDSSLDNSKCRP
jgi:hypothetical protein